MKKRFLRKITIDSEKPLPDNVVQVVDVSESYKVRLNDAGDPVYKKVLVVVVEEDVEAPRVDMNITFCEPGGTVSSDDSEEAVEK